MQWSNTTKNKISDLGFFGGDRLFGDIKITGQLAAPNEERFFELMRGVFERRHITNDGVMVRTLESKLCELHEVSECVAVANACFAIILAMSAFSPRREGEVLMPSFSYRGLPHLAKWAGLTPRFCDVREDCHTISLESIEANITPATGSILAVHNVNDLCQIDDLEAISRTHQIPLLFDSVYALGSRYRGRAMGSFGAAEVFSLHATKLVNGFEGGYVTTNDPDLAKSLRSLRNFGIESDGAIRSLGMNAKLNEIHAAMALANIDDVPTTIKENKRRYDKYRQLVDEIPGISIADYDAASNYSLVLLKVEDTWPISRKDMVRLLRAENALVRTYYDPPLHRSHQCDETLPISESLSKQYIQMPVGDFVSLEDIEKVMGWFLFVLRNAPNILDSIKDLKGSHHDGQRYSQ